MTRSNPTKRLADAILLLAAVSSNPFPNLIALVGWIFIFATTDWHIVLFGPGALGLEIVAYVIWSWHSRSWPLLTPLQWLQTE